MITATLMLASVFLATEPERPPLVSMEFMGLFEAHEYRLPEEITDAETRDIRYRLFVPRNLNPQERCPLIVWLHGLNEGGSENHHNLRHLPMVLNDLAQIEKYRFFILVPQCPSPKIDWMTRLGTHAANKQTVDMLTVTYELLQKTMQDHPIDPDRVSILGVCSGGSGGWELGMRHPEAFSAMGLISPDGGDSSRILKLIDIPIWCFHNQGDHPERTQRMVAGIRQVGGNVYLSLPQSNGHDCWTETLSKYRATDWLLTQRRNAWVCWNPPGCQSRRWWHIVGVPLGFAAIVGIAWMSERRRRRKGVHATASVNVESARKSP
jgi:predicted peptidase